jgi:hypothetical protein
MVGTAAVLAAWYDAAGGVESLVTAAAVVVGAGWAYRRFRTEREHAERVKVDVDGTVVEVGDGLGVSVRVTVTNEGKRLALISRSGGVAVQYMRVRDWAAGVATVRLEDESHDDVWWANLPALTVEPLTGAEDVAIEPRGCWTTNALFVLPDVEVVAVRVSAVADGVAVEEWRPVPGRGQPSRRLRRAWVQLTRVGGNRWRRVRWRLRSRNRRGPAPVDVSPHVPSYAADRIICDMRPPSKRTAGADG